MSVESSILAWAAKNAQKTLAPMADPDDTGVFTVAGLSGNWTGVMSIFEKVLVATPNGYEEQRQIKIAATRAQFTAAQQTTILTLPATRARIVARELNWTLTAIEPGAYHFVLTGVIAP